jgi:hypothetical protein
MSSTTPTGGIRGTSSSTPSSPRPPTSAHARSDRADPCAVGQRTAARTEPGRVRGAASFARARFNSVLTQTGVMSGRVRYGLGDRVKLGMVTRLARFERAPDARATSWPRPCPPARSTKFVSNRSVSRHLPVSGSCTQRGQPRRVSSTPSTPTGCGSTSSASARRTQAACATGQLIKPSHATLTVTPLLICSATCRRSRPVTRAPAGSSTICSVKKPFEDSAFRCSGTAPCASARPAAARRSAGPAAGSYDAAARCSSAPRTPGRTPPSRRRSPRAPPGSRQRHTGRSAPGREIHKIVSFPLNFEEPSCPAAGVGRVTRRLHRTAAGHLRTLVALRGRSRCYSRAFLRPFIRRNRCSRSVGEGSNSARCM